MRLPRLLLLLRRTLPRVLLLLRRTLLLRLLLLLRRTLLLGMCVWGGAVPARDRLLGVLLRPVNCRVCRLQSVKHHLA